MLALADELLPAHFTAALAQAEPVGEPAFHAFPGQQMAPLRQAGPLPRRDHPAR